MVWLGFPRVCNGCVDMCRSNPIGTTTSGKIQDASTASVSFSGFPPMGTGWTIYRIYLAFTMLFSGFGPNDPSLDST